MIQTRNRQCNPGEGDLREAGDASGLRPATRHTLRVNHVNAIPEASQRSINRTWRCIARRDATAATKRNTHAVQHVHSLAVAHRHCVECSGGCNGSERHKLHTIAQTASRSKWLEMHGQQTATAVTYAFHNFAQQRL